MYAPFSQLVGRPILSLQTGQTVAKIDHPILEISSLEVVAFLCQTQSGAQLLVPRDIRQYAADCLIVDGEEELTSPDDIVRFKNILNQRYSPIGQIVVTDAGNKLGIVSDYTINLETNRVQKLQIHKSVLQVWFGSDLMIDRTQIIDITPSRITVRDATVTSPLLGESLPEA